MAWIIVLSLATTFSAVNALVTRIYEAENRINGKYNVEPKAKQPSGFKKAFLI